MSEDVSRKLNVVIALLLRLMRSREGEDVKPNVGKDALYLRTFGLDYDEIAAILSSSPRSVAELVNRAQRTSRREP